MPVYEQTKYIPVRSWLDKAIHDKLPLSLYKDGPWVAGGAVRRSCMNQQLDGSDIDIFFRTEAQFQYWRTEMNDIPGVKCEPKPRTLDYTLPCGLRVQLVHGQFFSDPYELIESFDLTCCQFAIDGARLYVGQDSFYHARGKELHGANPDRLAISGKHVFNYIMDGYRPSRDVMMALLEQYARDPLILERLSAEY